MQKVILMSEKRINVCVDGNYLFHKTFGVIAGYGDKNPGDFLSSPGDRSLLMKKIMTDLCYSLNLIPGVDQVIFCKDSRSWRKDFKITRSSYKESRVKEEGVDWTSFFQLMEEFGAFLEKNGFHYSKVQGAEGDDLLWHWNKKLREKEQNVLIFTGDKDMHQLVGHNNQSWTIVWNANSKNNKIVCSKGWIDSIRVAEKEMSIFDVTPTSTDESQQLDSFLRMCIIEEIDPFEFIFKKILVGDKKDDVPAVYEFVNPKGSISRLTDSRAEKIWAVFKQSKWNGLDLEHVWKDAEFLEWVSGFILRSIGESDTLEKREIAKQNYYENAKLVWLNQEAIPEDLVYKMSILSNNQISESKIPLLNKKTMISTSPWGDVNSTPKQFDPFDLF